MLAAFDGLILDGCRGELPKSRRTKWGKVLQRALRERCPPGGLGAFLDTEGGIEASYLRTREHEKAARDTADAGDAGGGSVRAGPAPSEPEPEDEVPPPPASSPGDDLGRSDADEGGAPTFRLTDEVRRRFAAAKLEAGRRPCKVLLTGTLLANGEVALDEVKLSNLLGPPGSPRGKTPVSAPARRVTLRPGGLPRLPGRVTLSEKFRMKGP